MKLKKYYKVVFKRSIVGLIPIMKDVKDKAFESKTAALYFIENKISSELLKHKVPKESIKHIKIELVKFYKFDI